MQCNHKVNTGHHSIIKYKSQDLILPKIATGTESQHAFRVRHFFRGQSVHFMPVHLYPIFNGVMILCHIVRNKILIILCVWLGATHTPVRKPHLLGYCCLICDVHVV